MARKSSGFDFYLSSSLKVKCDDAIGLPIYGFLLMVNSNILGVPKLVYEIWGTLTLTFQGHSGSNGFL